MSLFRTTQPGEGFNPYEFYLGPKASDPTLDNNGDALVEGQYYWNTASDEVRFYNGTTWADLPTAGSTVTPANYGGVGDGVTNDTAALVAALATGQDVDLDGKSWLVNGGTLTMSTSFQKLFSSKGTGRLIKASNGTLLSVSGADTEFENVVLNGQGGTYTGSNFIITGTRPTLINCGSVSAAAFSLQYTGTGRIRIEGTNTGWNTSDLSGTGWDIDIGVSGTATLYHYLEDIYTSTATGGIRMTDVGSATINGGQFGKLSILSGTSPSGVNGGKISGARILGNTIMNLSSGTFVGNQFGSGTTITFGASTSLCKLDESNGLSGVTIVNNGNANNVIIREVSSGTVNSVSYGTHGNAQVSFNPSSPYSVTYPTNVGIGGTQSISSAKAFEINKSITGAGTTAVLADANANAQSDVTNNFISWRSSVGTAAASFTLSNLRHFQAQQGTVGAGSTVTTQEGFRADSSLTGATNNYGFRGSIASASNRYNLYMDGTADNYLAGILKVGTTGTPASGTTGTQIGATGPILNSVDTNGLNATFYKPSTPSQTAFLAFVENGSVIGSVTRASATTVAYNTSSDARLKEDIQPARAASGLIDKINIVSFKWKGHEVVSNFGVIAQELHKVFPEAVSEGVGDIPWGVDYSKLVPVLIKEIQDLRKRVADLEGK